ncbi:MAG TPA: hypothetical protein VFN14_02060 [Candidatus Limnocylindria bacterium]|nr:hypothetical protein [Candidatus Limnocylindria bacterium]
MQGTAAIGWEQLRLRAAAMTQLRGWALVPYALPLIAAVVYFFSGPMGSGTDVYVPLADAFLHGRFTIEGRSWLELVPTSGDGWLVPFPPAPALTLMPIVAVMGSQPWYAELPSNVMSSILGGANVALAWSMLSAWGVSVKTRTWLVIGFAFTIHWWVAGSAGTHHYAQVCGVFFTLIALNLAIRQKWPWVAGLMLGLAAASRLPMGLALPLLLGFYGYRPSWRHAELLLALAIPAMLVAAYNIARFGSPTDFGYARIQGTNGLVTDEPWFHNGIVSFTYIPRNLYAIFFQSFDWVDQVPFLRPTWSGTAITFTAPFLFWAVAARGRVAVALGAAAVLVLMPDLMHGSWGFAQFGYRFMLDAMPILLLLLGLVWRDRISLPARAAIVFSVAIHAYAFYVIYVLNFVA